MDMCVNNEYMIAFVAVLLHSCVEVYVMQKCYVP